MLTTYSNMLTNLNLTDMETCYKAMRGDLARSTRASAHGRIASVSSRRSPRVWRDVGCAHLRGPDQLLRAARTPKERRSDGRTASRRSGTSPSSTCSHERSVRRDGARPSVALLALASSAVGIVNRVHLRRPLHRRAESADARPATVGGACSDCRTGRRTAGGDGYRPLTILAFKIESAMGGRNPMRVPRRQHRALRRWRACSCSRSRSASCQCGPRGSPPRCSPCIRCTSRRWPTLSAKSELIVAVALISATILYMRDRLAGPLQLRTAVCDHRGAVRDCLFRQRTRHRAPGDSRGRRAHGRSDDATPWRARVRAVRPVLSRR